MDKRDYTVIGLHQNTGEPFVRTVYAESEGDAVVKSVERYQKAGNDIGDLVIVAAVFGRLDNLLEPPAFPAVNVLDEDEDE